MSIVPFRRNVSLEDAIEEFIYFKIAEGRAEQTIKDYRSHLRKQMTKRVGAQNTHRMIGIQANR